MMIKLIEEKFIELKKTNPVILNITNFVTMEFVANCLLSIGAAPIMSVYDDELEELVQLSSAININIGTLDEDFMRRAKKIVKLGKDYNKPIILDPVGAGATSIRTKFAQELIEYVDIVRGNASEIIGIGGGSNVTKGVESQHATNEAKDIADELAKRYKCTVVVSGPVDFITDGVRHCEVNYGTILMSLVTGMGCSLTGVIAGVKSITEDSFEASVIATYYFNMCGEIAYKKGREPGIFRECMIDALYSGNFKDMETLYYEKELRERIL